MSFQNPSCSVRLFLCCDHLQCPGKLIFSCFDVLFALTPDLIHSLRSLEDPYFFSNRCLHVLSKGLAPQLYRPYPDKCHRDPFSTSYSNGVKGTTRLSLHIQTHRHLESKVFQALSTFSLFYLSSSFFLSLLGPIVPFRLLIKPPTPFVVTVPVFTFFSFFDVPLLQASIHTVL